MPVIELRAGALVMVMGQPGVWEIEGFVARGVLLVPSTVSPAALLQSCQMFPPGKVEG